MFLMYIIVQYFFYHKICSIPLNTSSAFVRMILLFPLFPWCGIPSCWFIYLKHLLHPLDELHLIMIYNLECIVGFALLLFYWGFIKTFTSWLLMILNYILHFFCCLFFSFWGGLLDHYNLINLIWNSFLSFSVFEHWVRMVLVVVESRI